MKSLKDKIVDKLRAMHYTPSEKTKRHAVPVVSKPKKGEKEYPYGLELQLDEPTLKKLGVSGTPKSGKKVRLHAHGHVKHSSTSTDEDGTRRNVTVQITHLSLGKPE